MGWLDLLSFAFAALTGLLTLALRPWSYLWWGSIGACLSVTAVAAAHLFGLIEWPAAPPHLIDVRLESGIGDYLKGSGVDGITWNDSYSEAKVALTNSAEHDYRDLDIVVGTDLSLAAISITNKLGDCKWDANENLQMFAIVKDNSGETRKLMPTPANEVQPISPTRRIYCDKVVAHSTTEIELAVLTLNPIINGKWPKQLIAPRRKPAWVAIRGNYNDEGTKRPLFKAQCFAEPCNMPMQ